MAENYYWLCLEYNSEDPLNNFIDQMNKSTYFVAASGEPETEYQITPITYGLVANTGKYMGIFARGGISNIPTKPGINSNPT